MTESLSPSAPPMDMIDFRCPQCQKLLRITAAAAGKQSQCPECRTSMIVPMPATAGPAVDGVAGSGPQGSPDALGGTSAAPPGYPRGPAAQNVAPTEAGTPNQETIRDTLPLGKLPHVSSSDAMAPTKALFDRITTEIRKIYVGQDELVLGTLVALFSSGHVLIESVPGLGKTLFVRALGRVLGCQFGRIQFTADLMPSDITGAPIFDMKTAGVPLPSRPGLHAVPAGRRNQPLAGQDARGAAGDHAGISRHGRADQPQARAAVSGAGHAEPDRESEGTYNLPEAQLDRFMFKIVADYPSAEEEAGDAQDAQPAGRSRSAAGDTICKRSRRPRRSWTTTQACGKVHVDDKLFDYINTLVRPTRQWPQFHLGASPRAGIAPVQGAAHAGGLSRPRLCRARRRGARSPCRRCGIA